MDSTGENKKTQPTIYTVATAHLDTVWNWDLKQTIKEFLVNTMVDNFKLFEKYPNYKFNFEGAYRYALIKEYYPEMYEKLKEYIEQGRWFVTGTGWENGDVNIPSPEALMRNFLYGNEFFKEEFGKQSNDIFLPDCFGFSYTLPTIAAHMGIKSFSSAKLVWSKGNVLPFDVGMWKGIDGKEIVAVLNPMSYISRVDRDLSQDDETYERINKYNVPKYMRYYGTGDVGGAPNEGSAANVSKAVDNPNPKVKVVSAYAGQIADEMTDAEKGMLPSYRGELLMSTHAVGGYTSITTSKRWNRKNELLADSAERISVAADWLKGKEYPKAVLKDAWKRVIAHQFHDDLPGTSLMRVYTESYNDYVISMNQFSNELASGVASVVKAMDTRVGRGIPVVIYNPVERKRNESVKANVTFKNAPEFVRVYNSKGQEVPSQIADINGNNVTVIFTAEVGAVGCSVYDVVPSDMPCSMNTGLSVTENSLENKYYKVKINENGDISSIFDKTTNKELLKAPITYQLMSNNFTLYGAWEILYEDVIADPYAIVDSKPEIEIIENGPSRIALKVERQHRASSYKQIISLSADDSKRVDVENTIYWAETESFLKVAFPVTASNPNATFDLGIGTIERPNSTPVLYEVPAQQWADITDTTGEYGVTIINDSKYAWDKTNDNQLRLTLIHTPQNKWMNETRQDIMDFGENRVNFSIMGHSGDYCNGQSHIAAACMNQPLVAFQTEEHEGALGKDFSFVNISTDQVKISAIKQAENSGDVVVRFVECHGKSAENVSFSIGNGIVSAVEVNGAELKTGEAEVRDGKLFFNINAFEPKSFALKLAEAPAISSVPVQKALELEYNIEAISYNKENIVSGLGAQKATIPGELVPDEITAGGVKFKFGPKGASMKNALITKGQVLSLPANTSRLHIAAASLNGDTSVSFKAGNKEISLSIQSINEKIGGWDQYGLNYYGRIKRDPVAFVATHTHTPEGDSVNDKLYLFHYSVDIPEECTELQLPDNDNIVIFAATAEMGSYDFKAASYLYDVKEEARINNLKVVNGDGSGQYRTGNPVYITYKGSEKGDVIWSDQYGKKYYGINITINMPEKDLTLTPEVIPYGRDLAKSAVSIASAADKGNDSCNMFDGNDSTLWIAGGSGNKWAIFDLGEPKAVDRYIIKNAGFGGHDVKLNTSDWTLEAWNNDEWIPVDRVKANRFNANNRSITPVKAQYFRLNISKPTTINSDTKARIYGLELYCVKNNADFMVCKNTKNPMLPGEMPSEEDNLKQHIKEINIVKNANLQYYNIQFSNDMYVDRWMIKSADQPATYKLQFSEDGQTWITRDIAIVDKNGADRIFTPFISQHIRIETDRITDEVPVMIYGKNMIPVLKGKWPASKAHTRNHMPEYNPKDELPGALRVADGDGSGHDIFGLDVFLKAGKCSMGFKFKAEIGALTETDLLFRFNPLLPSGELYPRDITVGDYNAMPKDENGYVTAFAVFEVPGDCTVQMRIMNERKAKLTFLEVYAYEGKTGDGSVS